MQPVQQGKKLHYLQGKTIPALLRDMSQLRKTGISWFDSNSDVTSLKKNKNQPMLTTNEIRHRTGYHHKEFPKNP